MNAHYEKVIVACAFLTLFVNIGFPSTSFNVYMPYVVGEVGDVGGSLVLALRTLASMGAVIVVDRYFHLFDLRVGLALGFAFTATGFVVYGFASSLPVFLVGGVVTGLGYGLGGMVGVTMLIRRWYASGFSGAIGLASVGSGVASVIVPICAVHLIEGLSLSISFRIQAFVALVIG
ncbi:MAG: MFS transporter, partial [Slackia sp.]|nr:MFS transporter [Slackia sp.]